MKVNKLYLIALIFLSSCGSNSKQNVSINDYAVPKCGRSTCTSCEKVVIYKKQYLTNNTIYSKL